MFQSAILLVLSTKQCLPLDRLDPLSS
jgi:hypothetical protein